MMNVLLRPIDTFGKIYDRYIIYLSERVECVVAWAIFLAFFAIGFLDFIGKRIFSVSLVFVLAISKPSEFQVVFFVCLVHSFISVIFTVLCCVCVCIYFTRWQSATKTCCSAFEIFRSKNNRTSDIHFIGFSAIFNVLFNTDCIHVL